MADAESVVNALREAGYALRGQRARLNGERVDADRVRVAAVAECRAQGLRPTGRLVASIMNGWAWHDDTKPAAPAPEPPAPVVDDLGLPLPTVEEMADEAAWWVDTFFTYSLAFTSEAPWIFDNDDVNCDAVPADIRRTAFRAGLTVAAAHGVPGSAPTMRQVVNALIRRMAKDGRLKRS